jgi:hypothetical protein
MRPSEDLERGLDWLAQAMEALDPAVVVVATGAAITTGARDRERVRNYFARFPRDADRLIVWRPTGLWEQALLQKMAESLSVVGSFDGIDDPVPNRDVVYASLPAEGLRQSFSHAQLQDVVDKLEASKASRAFVSIESNQSFREATLLRALFEGKA